MYRLILVMSVSLALFGGTAQLSLQPQLPQSRTAGPMFTASSDESQLAVPDSTSEAPGLADGLTATLEDVGAMLDAPGLKNMKSDRSARPTPFDENWRFKTTPKSHPDDFTQLEDNLGLFRVYCGGQVCRDDVTVTMLHIEDVAHFLTAQSTQTMEPNGWAITGLPTNFTSTGTTHTIPGTLLEEPAHVRFTPIGFNWDYGDGTHTTAPTPGATWATLNQPEFTRTATSHTYTTTGTFTIRHSITYRAEYSLNNSPFVPITGTLTLPTNTLTITTTGAKTVLVDRNCTTTPTGPGC